jgi:hypothetical protein
MEVALPSADATGGVELPLVSLEVVSSSSKASTDHLPEATNEAESSPQAYAENVAPIASETVLSVPEESAILTDDAASLDDAAEGLATSDASIPRLNPAPRIVPRVAPVLRHNCGRRSVSSSPGASPCSSPLPSTGALASTADSGLGSQRTSGLSTTATTVRSTLSVCDTLKCAYC